jgi:protein-S-isoprenylcysteine O-methyltransferase Ste14
MNANTSAGQSNAKTGVAALLLRGLLQVIILLPIMAALLFIPAGRLDWVMAWILLGVYLAGLFVTSLLAARIDPDLARERRKAPQGAKSWDKTLINLSNLLFFLVMLPLAGLDRRFGWSPQVHLAVQIIALSVFVLGYGLVGWAMVSNRFFSAIVRIQDDRGHAVASGGPYRYVRHPGYVGMITMLLVAPLVLGSLWAFIPAGLAACIFVVRTALEDRTLQEELEGYQDYVQRVSYRLLPGVW